MGSRALDCAFMNNKVVTTKYTLLNFLPKNLMLQFSKAANVYFLIIAFMQMNKSITTTEGKPA